MTTYNSDNPIDTIVNVVDIQSCRTTCQGDANCVAVTYDTNFSCQTMGSIDEVTDRDNSTGAVPTCNNPDEEIIVPDQVADGGVMQVECDAGSGNLRIIDTRWGEESLLSDPAGNSDNIRLPTSKVSDICDAQTSCHFTINTDALGDHPDTHAKVFRMWYQCIPDTDNATVNPWTAWSDCSATCGPNASRTRTRTQKAPAQAGGLTLELQDLALSVTESCNIPVCDKNAVMSAWGGWSDCNRTCGGGTQTRNRTVAQSSAGNGITGPTAQSQPCSTQYCPANAIVSEWGAWGACSKTCDEDNTQTRTRQQTSAAQYGGQTLAEQGITGFTQSQDCAFKEPCGCYLNNVEYHGYDIISYSGVPNPLLCQQKCQASPDVCGFFMWQNSDKRCWLKNPNAYRGREDQSDPQARSLVVGPRTCANSADDMAEMPAIPEYASGSIRCLSGRSITILGGIWGVPADATSGNFTNQFNRRTQAGSNCDSANSCVDITPNEGSTGPWGLGDPAVGLAEDLYLWYNCRQ
eukprot:GHVS01054625.1.p1 GENE.GHVS01054625.1~~GHVS01054625.1.p1  ORF type:complete len:520 (+),score=11.68 GHVS01054625.1:486-2045(+)